MTFPSLAGFLQFSFIVSTPCIFGPPLSIYSILCKVTDIYDGGRVLDASAHLLSRGFVSQSASVTCSGSRYIVRILFTRMRLLVFSLRYTIGVLKHGRRASKARELAYKMFSYFKREADAICMSNSAPPAFVRAGNFTYQVLYLLFFAGLQGSRVPKET
jgi:hypothetical protein